MEVSIIAQSPDPGPTGATDTIIVGGGAAGLATAIFAGRERRAQTPGANLRPIVLVDGARTLGAKILISGGSRCNVTNANVEAGDFFRPGSSFVKQVLRAFPVRETITFFEEIGVTLKEEPLGKLFPETNKSRTVLQALLTEANRSSVDIQTSRRVLGLRQQDGGFAVETPAGVFQARRVVLATGGLSLPKTGSDGFGHALARQLGHSIVPPVPALEPLILRGDFHPPISGISHEAAIRIPREKEKPIVLLGSLLWTHFGLSGPLALDASRFFRRAQAEGAKAAVSLSFVPHFTAESVEKAVIEAARDRPRTHASAMIVQTFGLVRALAQRITVCAAGGDEPLSRLTHEKRRALALALTSFPLDVVDGRGYNFAEVTSGGVSIEEVDPKTMESRLAPGLYFVGEILDVDGRIGGFNFQWAWATAKVAGRALAKVR